LCVFVSCTTGDGQQAVINYEPTENSTKILQSIQSKVVDMEKAGIDTNYANLYKEVYDE